MIKPLPPLGLIGAAAIREAFAGDYIQLADLLRGALRGLFKLEGDADPYPYVRAVFADAVIAERNGKLLRYPYTVDGTAVTFGQPSEVLVSYADVKGNAGAAREGVFLEAKTEGGDKGACGFRIRVIRAGLSGNARYYPDAVLREAVPLFNGARVFVKSDEEHLRGQGKDVRNLIGQLSNVAFVEGQGKDSGEIQADLNLLEPHGNVAVKMREAWDRNMTSLFGFSIDAVGIAPEKKVGASVIREAKKITKVKSVDLIVDPGAGGEVIDILEAQSEETEEMWRDELLRMIESLRPELLAGKDKQALSDDDLQAILREAQPPPAPEVKQVAPAAGPDAVAEAVRLVEARMAARGRIAASTLPQAAKERLAAQFAAEEEFTEAQVVQAIKDEAAYLARFSDAGAVRGLGDDFPRVEPGESRAEKTMRMLEAFFDPTNKDHRHAQSFKQCYVQITGDSRVTGMVRHCDQALLREALNSASFDDVLGDSITRRLIADYRTPSVYDIWRPLAIVTGPSDFRTQERTRYGGYGDLPAVAEAGPYTALTSPADEKATYAVTKRGGTETITIEMIKNDDVGVIRQIPVKLSRAGKRTLAKFVLDFLRTNPAIYDTVALFHASHGNLLSAALDAAGWAAARLAMMKQAEAGSADRLGIAPKYLWVPADLEETASNIFRRNTNQDETFIQSLKPAIMPVWYWTDANDWGASADPNDIPTIEIGFLDGQEEPELFTQDNPTVGSLFSSDQLTYKIRHVYGGNVLDYRGLLKSVVA